jgi:hypothetical protein
VVSPAGIVKKHVVSPAGIVTKTCGHLLALFQKGWVPRLLVQALVQKPLGPPAGKVTKTTGDKNNGAHKLSYSSYKSMGSSAGIVTKTMGLTCWHSYKHR